MPPLAQKPRQRLIALAQKPASSSPSGTEEPRFSLNGPLVQDCTNGPSLTAFSPGVTPTATSPAGVLPTRCQPARKTFDRTPKKGKQHRYVFLPFLKCERGVFSSLHFFWVGLSSQVCMRRIKSMRKLSRTPSYQRPFHHFPKCVRAVRSLTCESRSDKYSNSAINSALGRPTYRNVQG